MAFTLIWGQLVSNCSHRDLLKHRMQTGVCSRACSWTTPLKRVWTETSDAFQEFSFYRDTMNFSCVQRPYWIKNRFLTYARVLQERGVAFTKHTPLCTRCKFIVPISKCKHAWDFAFEGHHQWIYTSGNWSWFLQGTGLPFLHSGIQIYFQKSHRQSSSSERLAGPYCHTLSWNRTFEKSLVVFSHRK